MEFCHFLASDLAVGKPVQAARTATVRKPLATLNAMFADGRQITTTSPHPDHGCGQTRALQSSRVEPSGQQSMSMQHPGWFSLMLIENWCSLITAATMLSPSPLPGVVRLASAR